MSLAARHNVPLLMLPACDTGIYERKYGLAQIEGPLQSGALLIRSRIPPRMSPARWVSLIAQSSASLTSAISGGCRARSAAPRGRCCEPYRSAD